MACTVLNCTRRDIPSIHDQLQPIMQVKAKSSLEGWEYCSECSNIYGAHLQLATRVGRFRNMPCAVVSKQFADVLAGLNTSPVVKDSNVVLRSLLSSTILPYTCTAISRTAEAALPLTFLLKYLLACNTICLGHDKSERCACRHAKLCASLWQPCEQHDRALL